MQELIFEEQCQESWQGNINNENVMTDFEQQDQDWKI